jgi:thiosulfate reductase cytochrome b subunit
MNEFGKFLVVLGLVIVAAGLLIWTGFGRGWIGRLPGDINYSRPNFSFHFPLMTCLVFSLVLSLLLWLLRK